MNGSYVYLWFLLKAEEHKMFVFPNNKNKPNVYHKIGSILYYYITLIVWDGIIQLF